MFVLCNKASCLVSSDMWYINLILHTHKRTQRHIAHWGTSGLTYPYTPILIYIYATCYVLTAAIFITLNG